MEEAVDHLQAAGCLQPCLFCTAQQQYFVKCDNIAIALPSASCFTEAVEFLFFTFWVFGVKYPQPLSLFYQFVERLVGVGCRSNSVVLCDRTVPSRMSHGFLVSSAHNCLSAPFSSLNQLSHSSFCLIRKWIQIRVSG